MNKNIVRQYLKKILTAPHTLIHLDFNLFEKEYKNLFQFMSDMNEFFRSLQRFSFYILFLNFIICIFFAEEEGVDRSFTAENYHNLTPLDNPNFHFYFIIFIYCAKLFFFCRMSFWFYFAIVFYAFGLSKEEAFENKKKHFYFQISIMVFIYMLILLFLFVIPGVPEFVLTRNMVLK